MDEYLSDKQYAADINDDFPAADEANGTVQSELSHLSDEELCIRAQSGDQLSEDTLIRRYYRLVSTLSRSYYLVGGSDDDLEQEGMIGLLSAIRSFTPSLSSFRTFASLCIRRSIINVIRTSQSKNNRFYNDSISYDQISRADELAYHPMEQDPEIQVIGNDDRKRTEQQLMSKLSDFERYVLTLYLSGLSYSEIAARLSKPVKAVDNAVQRIRRKIPRED